jgi:hypothetical protein
MMAIVIVFLFMAARRLERYGAFVVIFRQRLLRFVRSGELGRCERGSGVWSMEYRPSEWVLPHRRIQRQSYR